MYRRDFILNSMATAVVPSTALSASPLADIADIAGKPKLAVLLVDTDRVSTLIDDRIYGQFLEHINHSVEDGLFAEQIRGAGFEGEDFRIYWEPFSIRGRVDLAELDFQNGKKSVRIH